ncbi:hypothetical protein V1509DRAFT_623942 [Lipomyces kononenkoae]
MEAIITMPAPLIRTRHPSYYARLLQKNRSWLIPSILVIFAWTISLLIQHVIVLKIMAGMIQKAVYVFFSGHADPKASLDIVLNETMIPDIHESKISNRVKLMVAVALHIASVWYCDHCLSKFERQVAHSLRYRDDAAPSWRYLSKLAGLVLAVMLAVFGLYSLFRLTSYGYGHWLADTMITRSQILSSIRDWNGLFFVDRLKLHGIFCYLESFVTPSTTTSTSSLFALMVLFLEFHTHVFTTFVLAPVSNFLSAGVCGMREAIHELYYRSIAFLRVEREISANELHWKFSLRSSHVPYVVGIYIRNVSLSVDGPATPTSPSMNLKSSTSIFRRHKLKLLDNIKRARILSTQITNKANSRLSLSLTSADSKLLREQRKSVSGDFWPSSDNGKAVAVRQHSTMQDENRQTYKNSSRSTSEQSLLANFEESFSERINEGEADEASDANDLGYQHSIGSQSSVDSFTQYIQNNMAQNTQSSSSLPIFRRSRSAKGGPPFKSRSVSVSKYRYVANPKFSLPESPVKNKRSISTISVNIMSPKTATRAVENCV